MILITSCFLTLAGLYTCVGSNSAGVARVSAYLTVLEYDLREPPIILGVKQNEDSLECQIQNANQKDTTWTLNGTFVRKATYFTPIEVVNVQFLRTFSTIFISENFLLESLF